MIYNIQELPVGKTVVTIDLTGSVPEVTIDHTRSSGWHRPLQIAYDVNQISYANFTSKVNLSKDGVLVPGHGIMAGDIVTLNNGNVPNDTLEVLVTRLYANGDIEYYTTDLNFHGVVMTMTKGFTFVEFEMEWSDGQIVLFSDDSEVTW